MKSKTIKQQKTPYPESVMRRLRGRMGLDEGDKSQDERLQQMSPKAAFENVVAWELGDPAWGGTIMLWAKNCGVTMDDY